MERASIGVIGGSGIYQIEGLTETKEIKVKTPFGYPSDAIIVGVLGNQRIAFLPRHGRGHRILTRAQSPSDGRSQNCPSGRISTRSNRSASSASCRSALWAVCARISLRST